MNTSDPTEELTPDDLLSDFRSSSLPSIVIFTIAIHAVLLLGTSIPFLWRTIAGPDTSALTEEQRTEKAMKEATESLRKIAKEHGLKPQELSDQLGSAGSGSAPAGADPAGEVDEPETPVEPGDPVTSGTGPSPPGEPKTGIEKELEEKATGPSLPPVPGDDDDLFK